MVAFTRQGAAGRPAQEGVEWRDLDIFDVAGVTRAIQRLDVLVSSYQPGNAANDVGDAIRRSIADPTVYVRAAKVLLKALESRPATRLIVVGGAASLEIAPGRTTDDDDETLRDVLRLVPDLGSPQANWARNASVLRAEMRRGLPIRDASVNSVTGALENNTDFLLAERNLLQSNGWTYDASTHLWNPPH